ncbi:MAG TPA: zinc-binding alcohol dehydrogenase family protein [Tepidisphaeraceae bacterium]|nr:zinc-binding alcohol dehydrogenase family protein [Tepidisphaeraceae bacterium]
MNTLILENPQQFRFAQTDEPDLTLAPGQALVRVRRVGICGTDWHAYHGRQPFFTYPRILGHELGVVVEAVKDPASDLKPGDKCSVEPYMNCGVCIACRRGKTNCCAKLNVIGVHTDGGMRERIVLPARKLHKSDKLTLEQLALVETLGIGGHAVDRAAIERDEWVLIIGAGPIGLSIIPFAKAAGARVIVTDVSESRLAFCQKQMGVQHMIDARGDVLAELKRLTNEDLPTAVFDATGAPASMMKTFDCIAPGGRIIFVGLFQGDVTFNDPNFHRREISLLGSRNARASDFKRIIKMMEDGTVDTTPWITHRAACNQLVQTLPDWLKPDAGVIKAMVEF